MHLIFSDYIFNPDVRTNNRRLYFKRRWPTPGIEIPRKYAFLGAICPVRICSQFDIQSFIHDNRLPRILNWNNLQTTLKNPIPVFQVFKVNPMTIELIQVRVTHFDHDK